MADTEKPVQNAEEDAEESPKDDEKVKDAKVDGKKSKAKSKAKPVKEEKEEEEEESSEEEDHPGLYDKPLVIEGKRERKKTEFLVKDPDERKKPEPLQFNGTGDALGTMEVVNHEITQSTAFELKPMHKLLFGREGRANEIKKNIRLFNGFKIEEGTKEYENKKFGLEKFTNEGLKRLLEILDLEKKGTREDLKERIFTFLLNPKETGRSLKALQKKNEKKAKKKVKGKGEKRKRQPSKAKKAKKPKGKEEEIEEDDDDDEEKDKESEDEEEEEQPEEPKKKKAKTETPTKAKSTPSKPKQKTPSKSKKEDKKEAKKKSPKAKSKPVTVKITAGKRTPKKTPVKVNKADDSSDDEPLSKKTKKQEPTNDELAKTVKDLLKDADLDEITVKSVSKEVFAKYPDFDLSEKKGFIKETIYSVIAGDSTD
ncbi:protein DEK [Exaiptasia diaphana]|uniref:DEK-C domain-containing protein n=1 Tax=Exaiptasia diaphana TaxID=2652724 RepID=A0A913Y948_EXADI|nr:protein DEK [Exaiptasia diaphana]KXJ21200.1 Protein DEK [Exaiptasia diaphana]